MKVVRKTSIVVLAGLLAAAGFMGNEALARETGRRHGPPPEAYTACEGKAEGDRAQFKGRRGQTVTGTCEPDGERLLLRPDHPPRGKGRRSQSAEE